MAGPFKFSPRAGRFRDSRGRFLSARQVRGMIDRTLADHQRAVAEITELFRQRALSLQEWERRLRAEVKGIHLYSAMAAKGGRAQLTQSDFGRIGAAVKRQFKFLRRFANQIQTGQQQTDGTLVRRTALYAQAGRGSFEATRQREMKARGFDEESNVLAASEHCEGNGSCLEQTSRGWVSVGSLIPIGGRLCVTNCQCQIQYRNSATGEIAA